MSNFYKSKEVYKQIRTANNEVEIIPVRGMYVSGYHMEPYYIDHNITITEVTSTKCIANEYTETSFDPSPESVIKVSGYTSTAPTVVNYTDTSHEMEQGVLQISDYSATPANVVFYSSKDQDLKEGTLKVSAYTSTAPQYATFYVNETNFGYDHSITVEEVTSTPLVVDE